WQLAVGLLVGSTVLHLLHSDYGAIATTLLLLALVARRQDFDAPGDPEARPRVLGRALVFAVAIYAYGAVALWLNRLGGVQPCTPSTSARDTSRALFGLSVRRSHHLSDGIGHWFGPSVLLLGLLAAAALLHAWLAPWRHRVAQEATERELARALVASWGVDTL